MNARRGGLSQLVRCCLLCPAFPAGRSAAVLAAFSVLCRLEVRLARALPVNFSREDVVAKRRPVLRVGDSLTCAIMA